MLHVRHFVRLVAALAALALAGSGGCGDGARAGDGNRPAAAIDGNFPLPRAQIGAGAPAPVVTTIDGGNNAANQADAALTTQPDATAPGEGSGAGTGRGTGEGIAAGTGLGAGGVSNGTANIPTDPTGGLNGIGGTQVGTGASETGGGIPGAAGLGAAGTGGSVANGPSGTGVVQPPPPDAGVRAPGFVIEIP
jgi:hypothetical protein